MAMLRQFNALNPWLRGLIAFCIIWGLLVVIFVSKLNMPQPTDSANAIRRLNLAIAYLEQTQQRNAELSDLITELLNDKSLPPEQHQKLIADIQAKIAQQLSPDMRFDGRDGSALLAPGGGDSNAEPSLEYEQLRRRIYTNTQEMWRYVQHEVLQLRKTIGQTLVASGAGGIDAKLAKQMDDIVSMGAELKSTLLNDMDHMREVDGYEAWRKRESEALSDLVQRRLIGLQNPESCSSRQKLVCRLNKVIFFWLYFWDGFVHHEI